MPDPNNTNYCAYCGCWALEQFEGFCLACWDDFKKKAKEEKEMNIADGVVAEAKEIKLTPESEVQIAQDFADAHRCLETSMLSTGLKGDALDAFWMDQLAQLKDRLTAALVKYSASKPPAPSPESPGPSAPPPA